MRNDKLIRKGLPDREKINAVFSGDNMATSWHWQCVYFHFTPSLSPIISFWKPKGCCQLWKKLLWLQGMSGGPDLSSILCSYFKLDPFVFSGNVWYSIWYTGKIISIVRKSQVFFGLKDTLEINGIWKPIRKWMKCLLKDSRMLLYYSGLIQKVCFGTITFVFSYFW